MTSLIFTYKAPSVNMTLNKSPLRLLRFPSSVFDASSPNSSRLISFLTDVINTGYEAGTKKYNVITSTRIKSQDVFMGDLGFYKPESFILVLIKSDGVDSLEASEELKRLVSSGVGLEIEEMTKELDPESDLRIEGVLGTVGGKLYDGDGTTDGETGWEITGFTSFLKGVGSYLIKTLEDLAVRAGKDFLFASVIYEHDLVRYYAQFGFTEHSEKLLQEVDDTGRVISGDLEDGIYATRDFHVAFLKRPLSSGVHA